MALGHESSAPQHGTVTRPLARGRSRTWTLRQVPAWSRARPPWPLPSVQARRRGAGGGPQLPDPSAAWGTPWGQLSGQNWELAESADGVTITVCEGTQRHGAAFLSLKPGVLAEEGGRGRHSRPPFRQLSQLRCLADAGLHLRLFTYAWLVACESFLLG